MEKEATIMNKEELATELKTAFTAVEDLLRSCPSELLNKKTADGGWTPGQVVRHITKSTAGIPDQHTKPVDRPADEKAEILKGIFLNMGTKMQAPDFTRPENKDYEKSELLEELKKNNQHLSSIALVKELTDICLDFEFPMVGHMTRYEWLRFITFHTQRHTIQLSNTITALHEKS